VAGARSQTAPVTLDYVARAQLSRVLPAVPLLLLAASCHASSNGATPPPTQPTPASSTPATQPTKTIVRTSRHLLVGQTAAFAGQPGVAVRITVGRPSFSRTRLSSSYGDGPAHGYYASFRITIVNTGSRVVEVVPATLKLHVPGLGTITSYDGNAPYSGASRQLDNTELDPGQRVSAPLTFDVNGVHGVFEFVPDNSVAVSWRY
jgi:hypothetical protein